MKRRPFSIFCPKHPGEQKTSLVKSDGSTIYVCMPCYAEEALHKAESDEKLRRAIRRGGAF
jgi:Zn-finger protein